MLAEKPWSPTMSLRYAASGQLQQQWHRCVGEYSNHWKRVVYREEYEWRDIPAEQPTQETEPAPPRAPALSPLAVCYTCERTKAEHDGRSVMACDQFTL